MDFSSLTSVKALGLGSIAVAIASGWSTVKGLFSNLSAYIIVRAEFNDVASMRVKRYLKTHWSQVPSGAYHIYSVFLTHKDGIERPTPFRLLNKTEIFYSWKSKSFVIATLSGSDLKCWSIRGLVDFIEFTCDAHRSFKRSAEAKSSFYIRTVKGDALMMFLSKGGKGAGGSGHPSDSKVSIEPQMSVSVDYLEDKSFLYPESDYVFDSNDEPLKGLHYSPEILEHIESAKSWFSNEKWYIEHFIPHRRGWLIYGPGSTGKSSLAVAVAKTLGIPLISFALPTFSNEDFMDEWSRLPTPCVVLFEDFDTVFENRVNVTEHKSLSFECVLNQLSGVQTRSGIFLIVTTNRPDMIDEALGRPIPGTTLSTRPGRIDRTIFMGPADRECRLAMIKNILGSWPDTWEDVLDKSEGWVMGQVQEACVQIAFERLSHEKVL